jgi:PPK2 family polyphosphate:nucleotide phosphotransferase
MKAKDLHKYRVEPRSQVSLDDFDPEETDAFSGNKEEGEAALAELKEKLFGLQELLYSGQRHKVLVVLQGTDTSGKDGVIRHVFGGINPQGVRVAGFKAPTVDELAHDYLWRVHKQVPGKGEIAVFNRSHYEDVLVVRVHGLVPRDIWKTRYDGIVDFERTLAREGTTILKFYLHISPEEQKKRLQARLNDASKHWKFNPADLAERKLWGDYRKAYEDALSKTSTEYAPWYIVPANRKWYRNLTVAALLVEALEGLSMEYPKAGFDPKKIVIE